jgi:hypothetical protein
LADFLAHHCLLNGPTDVALDIPIRVIRVNNLEVIFLIFNSLLDSWRNEPASAVGAPPKEIGDPKSSEGDEGN